MESNHQILERVNPIFNTAKMSLFQLAEIGYKDAITISDKLKLTFEQTQKSTSFEGQPEEHLIATMMMETRYRTIESMIEKTGYNTIIDLPCGYTPRGINISLKGKKYFGLDLPATIDEFSPVIKPLIPEDKKLLVNYYGIDATNYASLEAALKNINEPVCIATEGLLMYFTESEINTLCDNIFKILKKNGGCWITADIESAFQYIMTVQSFYKDNFMEVMKKKSAKVAKKADVEIGKNSLIISPDKNAQENIKKAMMFLAKHGLKAERLNIADYMPEEINSFSKISKEQAEELKLKLKNCAYWKITIIDNNKPGDDNLDNNKFDIKSETDDEKLKLNITGRIDTLTAPHILELFEKIKSEKNIKATEINCENLEYISSAGLRVFKIMQNESKEGLTLINVNSKVLEILKESKFDEFIK